MAEVTKKDPVKTALLARLDKYLGRETLALVGGAYAMLEAQASPEIWAIFSLVAMLIFRGAKAFENYTMAKVHGTGTVEALLTAIAGATGKVVAEAVTEPKPVAEAKEVTVTDTQDTPTDKPTF
ncbi:MAG: hypothetical protein HN929_03495 [Chloroflexi bacterium]|jgi:hypothetical protein|nr:hypothetical protein [Chloroflexota bacterium]